MKKQLIIPLLLLCSLCMWGQTVHIDDFQAGGLYYRYLGGDSVAVIPPFGSNSYNRDTIVIPEQATQDSAIFFRVTAIARGAFSSNTTIRHIVLPSSVRVIEELTFDHSSVKTIVFGGQLDSIGQQAFENCHELTRITFPASLRSIAKLAFQYCTALDTLVIPNTVDTIGSSAFEGCTGLKMVTVGNGVSRLNGNCFNGCTVLKKVVLSEGLRSIKISAFGDCSVLDEINLPESVTDVSADAFYGCTSLPALYNSHHFVRLPRTLTTYTVPDGITTICMDAFEGCALTSVELPSSLTTINWMAFNYCQQLSTVTCHAQVPPTCIGANGQPDDDAFSSLPSTASLHVPEGTINAYSAATGWKKFSTITDQEAEPNVAMYHYLSGERFWTGATLEEAVANIPNDAGEVLIVVNANISTTEKFCIPNDKSVILIGANSDITVSLNQDILVTGAATLTIHDITLKAATASPNNYTYDGLIGIYNGTLKITGNTTVDASAAFINGIAANGSSASHLAISGTGNTIKGCMLTSGGNVSRYGLVVANNQIDVSLKSGTYMGHDGALDVSGGKILDVLGSNSAYYETNGLSYYETDYDANSIDCTVIVKEGYPLTCKVTENGNDIYYSSFQSAWDYCKDGSGRTMTITLFCNEETVISWNYVVTWSGSNHLTVDGRSNTLWFDGTLFVQGDLTLHHVTCRPRGSKTSFDETSSLIAVQQNGHLTIDGANILVMGDDDYYDHYSIDAIKVESNAETVNCSLIVKSGTIQGSLANDDAKRALIVTNSNATVRLYGGTLKGRDGAMYLPSSLSVEKLLDPGYVYFSDEAQTTLYNNGNYTGSHMIDDAVTIGGYYDLSVSSAGWASLCLPFAANVPEGATAFYVSQVNSNSITLSSISGVLPANQGVLIRANQGIYNFRPADTEGASITNHLTGTLQPTTMNRGENYVMGFVQEGHPVFCPYGDAADQASLGDISLQALKAYLPGSERPAFSSDAQIRCVIEGEEVVTDLKSVEAQPSIRKLLIDGRLVIEHEGTWFDTMGRKTGNQ